MEWTLWRILAVVITIVLSYLLGSVSFAIVVSKTLKKQDIRDYGSHNAGMTNTLRTYGKKAAILNSVGDFLKGSLAVIAGRLLFRYMGNFPDDWVMVGACIAGLCVVLGHVFPIYFQFKGGKGVLTSLGMFVFLDPVIALICLLIFIVVVVISRYVSLGSIAAMASVPFVALIYQSLLGEISWLFIAYAAVIGGIAVFMHRANIKRLINGTESKIGAKKKS